MIARTSHLDPIGRVVSAAIAPIQASFETARRDAQSLQQDSGGKDGRFAVAILIDIAAGLIGDMNNERIFAGDLESPGLRIVAAWSPSCAIDDLLDDGGGIFWLGRFRALKHSRERPLGELSFQPLQGAGIAPAQSRDDGFSEIGV